MQYEARVQQQEWHDTAKQGVAGRLGGLAGRIFSRDSGTHTMGTEKIIV